MISSLIFALDSLINENQSGCCRGFGHGLEMNTICMRLSKDLHMTSTSQALGLHLDHEPIMGALFPSRTRDEPPLNLNVMVE